jgi:predicted membrane channel-forming protein YqfA (hemolysin III family)
MNPRQAHRSATLMFSLVMVVIGVALIAQAVSGHGGIVSPHLLLGVLFIAAGGGRLYLEAKRGGRES